MADHFNPVAIRVKHEGDVAHATVCELLLELVTGILQSLTRSLNVVDRNTKVAEAFVRLGVAIVNRVVGVVFGAIVVCELNNSFAVCPVIGVRDSLGAIVCEKVEIKSGIGLLDVVDLLHAQELVELDRALRILDTDPQNGQPWTNCVC